MIKGPGDTFREEALELLGDLEIALLDIEERPRDHDAVGRVFRALHTLKGAGSMAGFVEVSKLLHEVESVFERVRSGELAVSSELVSLTLAMRDQVKGMVEAGPGSAPTQEGRSVAAALRKFLPQEARDIPPSRAAAGGLSERSVTYRIRFRPPAEIFRRGLDPLKLLRELESLGETLVVARTDAVPPLTELDAEICHLSWDVILTTTAGEDAIRDVFIFVEDEGELSIEAIELGPEADFTRLRELVIEDGNLSPESLQLSLTQKIPGEPLAERRFDEAAPPGDQQEERRQLQEVDGGAGSNLRVRSEKLDALVDLVGELVTVQARLSQMAGRKGDADLTAVAEDVERLTWELRDQVLNIRTLPIGSTFSKFRRLVRDLGEELGKDVELTTEGAETELDKTVIEGLHEPLVHLIRNGIGHGIEPPEVRRASGKPPRGRIHLAASHCGAGVLLRVSDDGAGLDREAIRQRAAALGLNAAADLTDRELFGLIFHSGLSTAGEVTSLSGRGVGMDVVRRAIESLRGTIEVSSSPGEGTTFTIRLPLTLAIIEGLLVQVGGDHFVLPLSEVEECIELKRGTAARGCGRSLIDVRGEIVPYIRLRERFGTAGEAPQIEQVVVARSEGERIGFVVDEVIGGHQTVIKSMGRLCRDVPGFSGATILGDGTVALVLDLPELIQTAAE